MRHMGRLATLALAIALGGGLSAAVEAHEQDGMGYGMGMGMGHGMGMWSGMWGEGPKDMTERFGEADADGDGKLDRDELVAGMTARAEDRISARADRMIEGRDADGDGMLTLEEMRAGPTGRIFDGLDADGDGSISREEFTKMRELYRGMDRSHMRGYGHDK
ncbi:MAG: EF-hand domain-containing protein [Roseovarius sp.]